MVNRVIVGMNRLSLDKTLSLVALLVKLRTLLVDRGTVRGLLVTALQDEIQVIKVLSNVLGFYLREE